jgi:hypothetical protein
MFTSKNPAITDDGKAIKDGDGDGRDKLGRFPEEKLGKKERANGVNKF